MPTPKGPKQLQRHVVPDVRAHLKIGIFTMARMAHAKVPKARPNFQKHKACIEVRTALKFLSRV